MREVCTVSRSYYRTTLATKTLPSDRRSRISFVALAWLLGWSDFGSKFDGVCIRAIQGNLLVLAVKNALSSLFYFKPVV